MSFADLLDHLLAPTALDIIRGSPPPVTADAKVRRRWPTRGHRSVAAPAPAFEGHRRPLGEAQP